MAGFKVFWRYRWVLAIIGGIGTVLRLAWFIFSHYTWLVGIAAMIAALFGQYYSPKITDAILAGLVAFTAIQVLGWKSRLQAARANPPSQDQMGQMHSEIKKADVDYAVWDRVDPLKLWQAASLWAGEDPTRAAMGGSNKSAPIILYLKQQVLKRQIPAQGAGVEMAFSEKNAEYVPDDVTLTRASLINLASVHAERPPFLFPTARV